MRYPLYVALTVGLEICVRAADLSSAVSSYTTGAIDAETFRADLSAAQAERDVRATLWLARLYHRGRAGVSRDVRRAHRMAVPAIRSVEAMKHDPEALFLIGSVYHEGLGVLPDFEKAVSFYRQAVSHGHPSALVNLGVCHEFGQGVEKGRDAAIGLYRQAQRLGSERAVANLLRLGEKARDDAMLAEVLRDGPLVRVLGGQRKDVTNYLTLEGILTDHGPKLSISRAGPADGTQLEFFTDGIWITMEKGLVHGVEIRTLGPLGKTKYRGDLPFGLSWDDSRSAVLKKLGKPDESGEAGADASGVRLTYHFEQLSMALVFPSDGEGKLARWRVAYRRIKPDEKKAKPPTYRPSGEVYQIVGHLTRAGWPDDKVLAGFRRLAKAGDAIATMWLARLQFRGRATLPADPDAAQKIAKAVFPKVQLLAEAGDTEAQFLVAAGHYFGLGVPRDLGKAAVGYELPAAAGHVSAMNNLAFCLAHGLGTAPDIKRADELFRRAGSAGSQLARQNRRNHHSHDVPVRPEQRELLRQLSKVPMTHAIGLDIEEGIRLLEIHGIIRSPKNRRETVLGLADPEIHFPEDGLRLLCHINRRIKMIEVHGNGYSGSKQFGGTLPYGVTFDDERDAVLEKMGRPRSSGWVPDNDLYGMGYSTGRINASVMFPLKGKGNLLIWAVFEKWAVARPNWIRDLD